MEKLAILDAGSQYGKVIDRKVRELNVESFLLPIQTPITELAKYKGIIISGGPQSVYEPGAPQVDPKLFDMKIPILGICYGMQLMSFVKGKSVGKKLRREDGKINIKIDPSSKLFSGLDDDQSVLLTHGDSVFDAPSGWRVIGWSDGIITAIENESQNLYGVQFHPEVDLTENGKHILRNFLMNICNFSGSFSVIDRKKSAIDYIRSKVQDRSVLVLVSGGVDSAVCAVLCKEALGADRVFAIHIDNGFMRSNESSQVEKSLIDLGLKNLVVLRASEIYYSSKTQIINRDGSITNTKRLDETINPEEKRKIIGDTFMVLAQRKVQEMGLDLDKIYLAQGTLRPDLIESASINVSSEADVIKTHHNDTDLVRTLRKNGHIIEPLTEYHKDEVRELGLELGLPKSVVQRHPFPGPGLAIRVLCAENPIMDSSYDKTNAELNNLFSYYRTSNQNSSGSPLDELYISDNEKCEIKSILQKYDLNAQILPVLTVGIQGDSRSYKHLCVLSGNVNPIPWKSLFCLTLFIPKVYHNINRVVWAFGEKNVVLIKKITPTHLTPDVLDQLRQADDIVMQTLVDYNLLSKLSQVPVVSIPISFDDDQSKRSIAIRTIITNDFMTGRPSIPCTDIQEEPLLEMAKKIQSLNGISKVFYDLTSKPPATTEYE